MLTDSAAFVELKGPHSLEVFQLERFSEMQLLERRSSVLGFENTSFNILAAGAVRRFAALSVARLFVRCHRE